MNICCPGHGGNGAHGAFSTQRPQRPQRLSRSRWLALRARRIEWSRESSSVWCHAWRLWFVAPLDPVAGPSGRRHQLRPLW